VPGQPNARVRLFVPALFVGGRVDFAFYPSLELITALSVSPLQEGRHWVFGAVAL
jgi:hypothetical protein